MRNAWAVLISFLLAGANAVAASPEWARKDTLVRQGADLLVVCSGEGPSLDFARKVALDSCRNTAASMFTSRFAMRSTTIQTEKDVVFQQETTEDRKVEGLGCQPVNEASEELTGGSRVWLKCRFNAAQVKVEKLPEDSALELKPYTDAEPIEHQAVISGRNKSPPGKYLSEGTYRTLTLATVPACESILVQGTASRIVRCTSNPVRVQIRKIDTELVIRATGHVPKRIRLTATDQREDYGTIFLERK